MEEVVARIYPVSQDDRWQLALEPVGSGDIEISGPSGACSMWEKVNHMLYAGLPLDEFRFRFEDGLVIGWTMHAGVRATWEKRQSATPGVLDIPRLQRPPLEIFDARICQA